MKFRFCGDLDAPDWLLAEISVLSKLPALRLKLLSKQLLKHMIEGEIDVEKVKKQTVGILDNEMEIQGCIVALDFIFQSATRFNIDDSVLNKEIGQLGLPKENGDVISLLYKQERVKIRKKLEEESFKLPKIERIEWRTDYIVASGGVDLNTEKNMETETETEIEEGNKKVNGAEVQLKLCIQKDNKTKVKEDVSLLFDAEKFQVFCHEIAKAKEMMEATESN